jgi:hypothetical protein
MHEFLVYYNPKPEALNLSIGINEFCKLGKQAGN